MKDYYPAGAYDDPNAPYNEAPEPAPKKVKCLVTITLTKEVEVETTDYTEYIHEEYDTRNGRTMCHQHIEVDYSDCDLIKDFRRDNQTMSQYIVALHKVFEKKRKESKDTRTKVLLSDYLKTLEGWSEEIEVEQI